MNGVANDIWYGVFTCDSYPNDCFIPEADRVELLSPGLNNVSVDYLHFTVSPAIDPYLNPLATTSPKVTIVLKTSYSGTIATDPISYILQTTVSSRIYKP